METGYDKLKGEREIEIYRCIHELNKQREREKENSYSFEVYDNEINKVKNEFFCDNESANEAIKQFKIKDLMDKKESHKKHITSINYRINILSKHIEDLIKENNEKNR